MSALEIIPNSHRSRPHDHTHIVEFSKGALGGATPCHNGLELIQSVSSYSSVTVTSTGLIGMTDEMNSSRSVLNIDT